MKETFISLSERTFILEALKKENRVDGRRVQDVRTVKISFREQYGTAEVQYGKTRAFAAVSAEIVEPWPDRPTEGFFNFNVEFSPMANPSWEAGRPSPYAVEAQRIIERGLRDSNAIDTESLCIVAGEKVWSVKCDVVVLDDWGNVVDCAALATISSLLHFRRPEVTVEGTEVTVHSMEERTPVPLSIHHIPICVSFGFFSELNVMIVDPELKEECVISGRMTITMNIHKELCGIQKSGGNPIMAASVVRCSKIAAVKTAELTELMNQTLEDHWNSRKRKRDRVTPVGFSVPVTPGPADTPTPTPTPTPSISSSTPSSVPSKKSTTPSSSSSSSSTTTTSTPAVPPPSKPSSSASTSKAAKAPKPTQQPKEHIASSDKPMFEGGTNTWLDDYSSNKPSFPSEDAKSEFEEFAKQLTSNSNKDGAARKKARLEDEDETTTDKPKKDNKSKKATTKTTTESTTNKNKDEKQEEETKGDAVMRDVLDSWGAEGDDDSFATPKASKPAAGRRKEDSAKPARRGADGDGKKKRTKEIISLDD